MAQLIALVARFGRDERGVFAVIFGIMAIVLVALSGAVVDYVTLEQARNRSQIALDAAVLALQPEIHSATLTDEDIRSRAEALMRDRINDAKIKADVDTIRVNKEEGSLFLSARLTVPTNFVGLVGVHTLSAVVRSQAARGQLNVEVSIALDITGSMAGQDIEDLKESVTGLVDVIIKDDQEPYYSKIALVPYAQAVNAGKYAEALRGPIRGPKDITSISWASGNTKTITGATRAKQSNVEIKSAKHGFNTGDWVYIWDVQGMTQINNKPFQITSVTQDAFNLLNTSTGTYGTYSRAGSVVKCHVKNCDVVVTSPNHGYANDDDIYVANVLGMTALNNRIFRISNVTTDTLVLPDLAIGGGGTYVANTGKLHCTWQNKVEGCSYFVFTNTSKATQILAATTCVTDGTVKGIYDQPPTTSFMGRNYPAANTCPDASIIPLTADRAALKNVINGLKAKGNTAGSLGILWSWYMLSPHFASAWPESAPAPARYDEEHLLKAAIIMTDGEFNTAHCDGAVSRDSSGGTERINCNATNGKPYDQSRAYCDAMKAKDVGIKIYTVGFNIRKGTEAANIMAYCASSPDHAFLAQDGAQLRQAFDQIAKNISALRLTL
ncbi:ubiquitin-activating E1 FCCH domain-containing protein [Devosia sp. A449]